MNPDRPAGGRRRRWPAGSVHRARGMISERGQAFVELALVSALICVIIFGIIDFGVVLKDQQTLNHAAADGARIGARGDSPANSSSASSQVTTDLGDLSQSPSPSVTVSYSQGIPDYVTVTVSCTYSPITPLGSLVTFIGGAVNTTPTLSATTTMRVQ